MNAAAGFSISSLRLLAKKADADDLPLVEAEVEDWLWARIGQPVASFKAGALLWLTWHTKTENPKWVEQGLPFMARFPRKSYFVPVLAAMLTKERLFIPKSREMMTSWEVMGYAAWKCIWQAGTQVIVQADKEQKAWGLVDYARILWRNSDEWIKQRVGVVEDAKAHIQLSNGSEIIGVPSGADQIRFYHPSIFVMDEAAKLPEAQESYDAATPVAQQIVGISSAAPGWFADECAP